LLFISATKLHLTGSVEIVTNAIAHADHEPDELFSSRPFTVYIPKFPKSDNWYLGRREEGVDLVYFFMNDISPFSLLKFSINNDNGESRIVVSATIYATGSLLPTFFIKQIPIGQDPRSLEGEPIAIDREIIYFDLKMAI